MSAGGEGVALLRERALAHLDALAARGRLRRLAPAPFGPAVAPVGAAPAPLDLTHNDYLALRSDTSHQSAVRARLAHGDLPVGAGASRLLGGEHPLFGELERAFAAFKGQEAALYFPSGYAANEAIVPALAALFPAGGLRVFSDALNHASIIDGIRLAGLPRERREIFRHRDADDLAARLAASDAALNVIVTESIFSMDGDTADLARLAALARAHRGVLVVDEAHAVLCAGPDGRGLAAELAASGALITVDTCGKAMAAQGAFVSGPAWLRELLVNVARSFIYTTAPSPFIAAALQLTIASAPALAPRRQRLAQASSRLRASLRAAGLDVGAGPDWSHIVPILLGDDATAVQRADALRARGVLARAIRPPTVPEGTARIRLSLHAGLSDADIDRIAAAVGAP